MDKKGLYIRYSMAFKQHVVNQIESGQYSVVEAGRLYEVSYQSIYNWLRQLGKSGIIKQYVRIEMKREIDRLRQLEKEKQELESALAQAHLKILALESLLEVSQEHYGVDFKKNFGTGLSVPFSTSKGKGRKEEE